MHRTVYNCLDHLGCLPKPKPTPRDIPSHLTTDLKSVESFILVVVAAADEMVCTSHFGMNFRDLRQDVRVRLATVDLQAARPEVVELFDVFNEAGSTAEVVQTSVPVTASHQAEADEQADIDAAMAASLQEQPPAAGMSEADAVKLGLPSDKEIAQAYQRGEWDAGTRFDTLWKSFKLDQEPEVIPGWRDGLVSRAVVVYHAETGTLYAGQALEVAASSTAPAAGTTAHDIDTMDVDLPSGPATTGSTSMAAPEEPASAPALKVALAMIRQALLRFLRRWAATFPEPTEGTWPGDFGTKERTQIRKWIALYAEEESHGLTVHPFTKEAIETAIRDILQDTAFPVAKGHHAAALRAIIKEHNSMLKQAKKEAAEKGEAAPEEEPAVEETEDGEVPEPEQEGRKSKAGKRKREKEPEVEGERDGGEATEVERPVKAVRRRRSARLQSSDPVDEEMEG